jgi:hypothetical protein
MTFVKFAGWWWRSFRRERHKKKYFAIGRFFWDSSYRADIIHLARLTTRKRLYSIEGSMELRLIHPSHDINYPEWVDELERQIVEAKNVEAAIIPITVIFDWTRNLWLVVDGNHRLTALNRVYGGMMEIPVIILYEEGADLDELDFGLTTVPYRGYDAQEVR